MNRIQQVLDTCSKLKRYLKGSSRITNIKAFQIVNYVFMYVRGCSFNRSRYRRAGETIKQNLSQPTSKV